MRSLASSTLLLATLLVSSASFAGGGIYTYVEKDGTVVYTNVRPHGVKARKVKGSFHAAPKPDSAPAKAVWTRSTTKRSPGPASSTRCRWSWRGR
jgi:hypothetical protein